MTITNAKIKEKVEEKKASKSKKTQNQEVSAPVVDIPPMDDEKTESGLLTEE